MKSLKFLFLFLLMLSVAQAASQKTKKGLGLLLAGPDQRWIASPIKVTSVPTGWVYTQNYTRYLFEVENPYELGNISFFSMPITKENDNLKSASEVQAAFEKMFDIKPFILNPYKDQKNQWLIEGEFEKHGRWVRMLITRHKDRWSVSIAYLRKPYLESTDYSAAWIQDRLALREDQMIERVFEKKTSFILNFISPAYAQGMPLPPGWAVNDGGFMTPPSGSTGAYDPITIVNKDGTMAQMRPCPGPRPLPTTTSPTLCPSPSSCPDPTGPSGIPNPAYTSCVMNISACRSGQVGDAAAVIPGQVYNARDDAKCQSDWWAGRMDHESAVWGAKADRGLNFMEKTFSSANVAAMAAAGVIGASIASFGMSLAISGIQAGAEALWDLVSGKYAERKHQEIVKLFMENKEKWDKMNEEAMALSNSIDRSMELLELVKLSGKSLEQIIIDHKTKASELDTKIEDARAKYNREQAKYEYDEANQCVTDARDEYNILKKELVILSAEVEKLAKIKQDHGNFETMCKALDHNLSTLLQREGDLQNARMLLLKSYDHYQIEDNRRREEMREAGRHLQTEDPEKSFKDEIKRAGESYKKGIKSTEITKALEKAADACYFDNIKKNSWHNIICRVPILRGAPLLGGISKEKDSGAKAACIVIHSKCQSMTEKKNYLYRIGHTSLGGHNQAERKELIRAHRQYEQVLNTYNSDIKMAGQTRDQKTKVRPYLNWNEDLAREKTQAVHNWMMSMRLEQACSNLPTNCDDQADGNMFTKIKDKNGKTIRNEYLKKQTVNGKPTLKCVCNDSNDGKCNCGQVIQSEYYRCMQTRNDCDANKQGLLCYNLPYCKPTDNGEAKDYSSCTESCPKIDPNCTHSKTKTCMDQKAVAEGCANQFRSCDEEKQQTGCEEHFTKRCTGSQAFCDQLTKNCREQALNRSKFKFEKIHVQSDLIKTGACKGMMN